MFFFITIRSHFTYLFLIFTLKGGGGVLLSDSRFFTEDLYNMSFLRPLLFHVPPISVIRDSKIYVKITCYINETGTPLDDISRLMNTTQNLARYLPLFSQFKEGGGVGYFSHYFHSIDQFSLTWCYEQCPNNRQTK